MGQRTKQKWAKEDIQIANKHMQRCSIPFIIREMYIKTTVRVVIKNYKPHTGQNGHHLKVYER